MLKDIPAVLRPPLGCRTTGRPPAGRAPRAGAARGAPPLRSPGRGPAAPAINFEVAAAPAAAAASESEPPQARPRLGRRLGGGGTYCQCPVDSGPPGPAGFSGVRPPPGGG
jgi:hypothetical protein